MNVSNEKMIKRMEREVEIAKQQLNNHELFLRSIANIKLLCELMLDEQETTQLDSVKRENEVIIQKNDKHDRPSNEHNPSSIFDF